MTNSEKAADPCYPYTYAADYVRSLAGYNESGTKLSRSDASAISEGIALAIGIDKEEFKRRLADYFKANEEEIAAKSVASYMREAIRIDTRPIDPAFPFNQNYKPSSLLEE